LFAGFQHGWQGVPRGYSLSRRAVRASGTSFCRFQFAFS
jgi:hypothetical protein